MLPTHAYIKNDTEIECVFPQGYPASDLVELPEDYFTRGWYKWNNGFEDDIEGWRTYILNKANNIRDYRLYSGCETLIGEIDSDVNSRQLLYTIKLESLINTDSNFSVNITLKSNETVTCSRQDLDNIIISLRAHDQQAHDDCISVKEQALTSNTILYDLL